MNVSSGNIHASQLYLTHQTNVDLQACCCIIARDLKSVRNSNNKIMLEKTMRKTQQLMSKLTSGSVNIAKCMRGVKDITQTLNKEIISYQLAGSDDIKSLTELTGNLVKNAVKDKNFQSLSPEKKAKHHPAMPSKAQPDNTLTPSGAPTDNQAISSGDNRIVSNKSTFYFPVPE